MFQYGTDILDSKSRFLTPVLLFTLARLVMLLLGVESSHRGLEYLLYPSWGSNAFYDALIAATGYSSGSMAYWTIMPAFPSLVRLILGISFGFGAVGVTELFRFAWLVAVIISWIMATAAIPIFQSVAEKRMSRIEAMNLTLLMFFFPEVFVFSSLGFSSALFLLLELVAWVLLTKREYGGWLIAACLFCLTELCGFAMSIMLVTELFRSRMSKKIIYSLAPTIIFLMWLVYVEVETGNWMNVLGPGPYLLGYFSTLLGFTRFSIASGEVYFDPVISSSVLCFLMVVGLLAFRSCRVNRVMGSYAISMVIACAVLIPVGSVARLLSLIFPVWLNLRIRSIALTVALLSFFFLMSLLLWNGVITGYLG